MAEEKENAALEADAFYSIPRIYTNAVKVSRSYYDIQLILGTSSLNLLAKEPYQAIIPQSIVHMSPQHFKILTKILNEQLEKYEQEFGPIKEPPDIKKG